MDKITGYRIKKEKGLNFYEHIVWTSRALSVDPLRHVLSHLLVDGNKIVATDSRRLAIAEDEFFGLLEDGLYLVERVARAVLLIQANDAGTFPNYKQVIPAQFDTKFEVSGKTAQEAAGHAEFLLGKNGGGSLFLPYLIDAFSDQKMPSMEVHCSGETNAVKVENGARLAIIMPMMLP